MTTPRPDLVPAARHVAALVNAVPDDALDRSTPCEDYTVGDLLDHIDGGALAFRAAAIKQPPEGPPSVDASHLGPGEVAGVVALDELVIHGWDLAKATGQPAGYDGPGLEAVFGLVQQFRAEGVEGIFGPEVAVPDDAPLLDRIVGLAGRDPDWQPPE